MWGEGREEEGERRRRRRTRGRWRRERREVLIILTELFQRFTGSVEVYFPPRTEKTKKTPKNT